MPRRLASAVCAAALVAVAAPAVVLAQEPGAGKATSFAATFSAKRPATSTVVRSSTPRRPPCRPSCARR